MEAFVLEHLQRTDRIWLSKEEVDVVLGLRAAARVHGEPTCEGELDLVVAERRRGALHRRQELAEPTIAGHGGIVSGASDVQSSGTEGAWEKP
jgi:hypothetical protein